MPVFLTSTFRVQTAEDDRIFSISSLSARASRRDGCGPGLFAVQSPKHDRRDRLAVHERAEKCALFRPAWRRLRPRSSRFPFWRYCTPNRSMATEPCSRRRWRSTLGLADGIDEAAVELAGDELRKGAGGDDLDETPANPTNGVLHPALLRRIAANIGEAQDHVPIVACDNTLLGPVFQRPIEHGADISLYSLTKYVGGHSDLIAGSALGSKAIMKDIKALRGAIGTQLDPHSCWMISRSLETLSIRMEKLTHMRGSWRISGSCQVVKSIIFSIMTEASPPAARSRGNARAQLHILVRHCRRSGRRLQVPECADSLAVSLGGTESLASLPASMTHPAFPLTSVSGSAFSTPRSGGRTWTPSDLIADIAQALNEARQGCLYRGEPTSQAQA